jgi:hypothetical protein
MTHKNHFYCAFLPHLGSPSTSPPRFLHRKGYKACLVTLVQLHLPSRYPSIPPPPSVWMKREETEKHFFGNTKKVVVGLTGSGSSFLLCSKVESGWPTLVVT